MNLIALNGHRVSRCFDDKVRGDTRYRQYNLRGGDRFRCARIGIEFSHFVFHKVLKCRDDIISDREVFNTLDFNIK